MNMPFCFDQLNMPFCFDFWPDTRSSWCCHVVAGRRDDEPDSVGCAVLCREPERPATPRLLLSSRRTRCVVTAVPNVAYHSSFDYYTNSGCTKHMTEMCNCFTRKNEKNRAVVPKNTLTGALKL